MQLKKQKQNRVIIICVLLYVPCDGLASRPGGVEILLAASCYGNRDKLRQYEPVWLIRLHSLYVPLKFTAVAPSRIAVVGCQYCQ